MEQKEPRTYSRWFGLKAALISSAGLLVAVFTPPHGTTFAVCWFKSLTGFECIGCGLTRSLSCALRGMFSESLAYHPFGIFILLAFLAAIVVGMLPASRKKLLVDYMEARAVFFNGLFWIFIVSFVSFGAARFLHEMFGGN